MTSKQEITDIKSKLKDDNLTNFLIFFVNRIMNEKEIYQKQIAEDFNIVATDFSAIKNGYVSQKKQEYILGKLLHKYNDIPYSDLIDEINEEVEREEKEHEEYRRSGRFDLLGVIYISESNQLEKMTFRVDIEEGKISTTRVNGVTYTGESMFFTYVPSLNMNLVSNVNSDDSITILLNEDISRDNFYQKKILTGILTYSESNQIKISHLLIFNPIIVKNRKHWEDELKHYFHNPKLQQLFLSQKNRDIETILTIINEYKTDNRTVTINLPKELIISYKQFLNFFSEYVLVAKGIEIEFDVSSKANALEINVKANEEASMEDIGEYLNEYLGFAKQNIDKLKIPVETEISKTEFDILALDIKNQVTSLKHSLEIAHLKNDMLAKDNDYLKQVISSFANKDVIIQNQLIQGGEQQFADKIKNRNK